VSSITATQAGTSQFLLTRLIQSNIDRIIAFKFVTGIDWDQDFTASLQNGGHFTNTLQLHAHRSRMIVVVQQTIQEENKCEN
jgi:hypothetical protein